MRPSGVLYAFGYYSLFIVAVTGQINSPLCFILLESRTSKKRCCCAVLTVQKHRGGSQSDSIRVQNQKSLHLLSQMKKKLRSWIRMLFDIYALAKMVKWLATNFLFINYLWQLYIWDKNKMVNRSKIPH